jgi:F0F1-type ATP synthase membrane subunit b/b'
MSEQRDAFIERLKASLDQLNREIDELAARARRASGDAQERHQEDIDRLKAYREEARLRLNELQRAGSEAGEDLRRGAEQAWDRMREALRVAGSRFK